MNLVEIQMKDVSQEDAKYLKAWLIVGVFLVDQPERSLNMTQSMSFHTNIMYDLLCVIHMVKKVKGGWMFL